MANKVREKKEKHLNPETKTIILTRIYQCHLRPLTSISLSLPCNAPEDPAPAPCGASGLPGPGHVRGWAGRHHVLRARHVRVKEVPLPVGDGVGGLRPLINLNLFWLTLISFVTVMYGRDWKRKKNIAAILKYPDWMWRLSLHGLTNNQKLHGG